MFTFYLPKSILPRSYKKLYFYWVIPAMKVYDFVNQAVYHIIPSELFLINKMQRKCRIKLGTHAKNINSHPYFP